MITIKNISKIFTDEFGYTVPLLHDISIDILKEKITTVIAPSGAGKTSLLKIICGLEMQTDGIVGKNETTPVVFIPSEPSSFPWLNTYDNILFELRHKDKNLIKKIIAMVGLEGYEEHIPHNKSYGFRFRTALARALVRNPLIVVIDEPFNKMDETTKGEIYCLLREVNKELKTTILLATTNISEAVFLSDKIFLMKKNPGEVFESIDVALPSVRDSSILTSAEFNSTREKIENSFKSLDSQRLLNISI